MSDFKLVEPDKGDQNVTDKYRAIFMSEMGREVLQDILIELCHFGQYLTNEKEVCEHNMGVMILANCGVYKAGKKRDIINSLLI